MSKLRTQEQVEFAQLVSRLGPDSPVRLIQKALQHLQHDSKGQLGKVFIARQCGLSPMHIIDVHLPQFEDDATWLEAEYLGAAYCLPGDERHWRARLIRQIPTVAGQSLGATFEQSKKQAVYTGAALVSAMYPSLVEPPITAITSMKPAEIPVTEEEDRVNLALDAALYASIIKEIRLLNDAVRKAIPKRRPSLLRRIVSWGASGKTVNPAEKILTDAQLLHRVADSTHVKNQQTLYSRALGEDIAMPMHEVIVHSMYSHIRRLLTEVLDSAQGVLPHQG